MSDRLEFHAQLVLGESESAVQFLYDDRELEIPREKLVDFDEDGRFWLLASDAAALGLVEG